MERDKLLKKIDLFKDELINMRRHIHAHPELSGLENQTAILISGYLKNIGGRVTESVGRTGVVADFGPKDKGFIGLRVDMDALPIYENTNLSFSSKIDGIMHACGHDYFHFKEGNITELGFDKDLPRIGLLNGQDMSVNYAKAKHQGLKEWECDGKIWNEEKYWEWRN